MANNIDWGQGAINNNIGWGQGAKNNSIGWGASQFTSPAGETEIYGARTDADATSFLTATAITDATITSAIDTLVVDLKAYGIWSKMKAIYPFVGGTATTHKYNLINPTDSDAAFRLAFTGGWSHSANGVTPNGTNGYADTFLTPSTSLILNSTHLSLYSRTNKSENGIDIGTWGTNYTYAHWNYGGTVAFRGINAASTTRALYATTNNFLIGSRIVNNNEMYFVNGIKFNDYGAPSTALPTTKLYIGAVNTGTNVGNYYSSKQYAFSSIGDGLSITESANFYTAVQKFQTTLGRQV